MVNIRQKGFNGEREIATLLNGLLIITMREMGFPEEQISARSIQRNQNQSAVGGNDLSNTMGLGIEVKRHENISGINGWWTQCVEGAKRNNEHPVLLYRQNHGKWRCRTLAHLVLPYGDNTVIAVADFDYLAFQEWFKAWCKDHLTNGGGVRT